MASVFTKIINGELPSYKIAEDENFYSFLDIKPLTKGHTLVVPKQEVDDFFDLEDQTIASLSVFAKKIAHSLKKSFPCEKVSFLVLGLEVRHAHVHLVPFNEERELQFTRPKLKLSQEEFEEIAAKIKSNL